MFFSHKRQMDLVIVAFLNDSGHLQNHALIS